MTFEMKTTMHPEDQAELDYMKKIPNRDGTIGFMLKDGTEAAEWFAYYRARRPRKADALYRALESGREYMVAARFPQWFDPSWHPVGEPKERVIPVKEKSNLNEKERALIVERYLKGFRGTANGKDYNF